MKHRTLSNQLGLMTSQLLAAIDVTDSAEILAQHLPRLGIQHALVAVYSQQDDDPVSHSHGPGGDHSHTGTAFTTWLDINQAKQQAEAILKALSKKRPAYKAEFENRFETLRKELMQLDLDIQKLLAKQPGEPLFASHPVYQYFARRYQLHMQSVLWEPDIVPTEEQWQQLIYAQEAFPASWMLWEAEPAAETRARLEKHGIHSVVFDTCANTPENGDFMSVMRANIDRLGNIFQ